MSTTLAVANQKGGVAKTTSVASIGAALAELDQKVLLVDLDPQACLTFSLGIDPEGEGQAGLRVEVDQQHRLAELGQRRADGRDGRRLGHAALLVGDRQDDRGNGDDGVDGGSRHRDGTGCGGHRLPSCPRPLPAARMRGLAGGHVS